MRKVLILLLILASAPAAFAQWTRAGLFGADVRALVVDPKKPDTVYLGTSQGEVYVSRDGAATWTNPRRGNPFPGYVVDSLLVDRAGRLWAACWGLWGGGVIAVSDDGGITWDRRDRGLEEFSVRALTVDARDEDLLLAGGLTGVYRTRDGGKTWHQISTRINVESLAIDPRDSDRIYVGTWRQAFRSEDGGKTWALINQGMVLDTDVFSINIHPAKPDNIWLSTCGWVYNSPDRGDTWTRYKDGFNNRRIHAIDVDQATSAVYAGSVAGLYRSADLGKSWQLISDESLVINGIGLHPARPDRIILGTEGDGVYVSNDGGKTFVRSSRGLYNVRVAEVVADPERRGRLFAAVYFGGSASGFYQSSDGGKSWERLNRDKLPEILTFVVRPVAAGSRFVAGTEKGFYWSADGMTWATAEPSTFPLRVSKVLPFNSQRLFAATSDGIYTSKDGGKNWYRLGAVQDRTLDLAIGRLSGRTALYALTEAGLIVFDGEQWLTIDGAPGKGRTVAVRSDGEHDLVVIAGSQGVHAGSVDVLRKWHRVPAPAIGFANVFQTYRAEERSVVLTSRERPDLYISGRRTGWQSVPFPESSIDVASISGDPFDTSRLYVGTGGQGIFIYGALDQAYAASERARRDGAAYLGGGSK